MAKKPNLGATVLKMQRQVIKLGTACKKWDEEQDETAKELLKQQLEFEHEKLKQLTALVTELLS
jgi:hypothetical protein